jgi:hypothetical protein
MSTVSSARMDVTDTIAAALPGLPVWAYPPNNVATPCAYVQLGAATAEPIADRWEAQLQVTLVAPGGDNEMAVLALEEMILTVARAVSLEYTVPVTWGLPGITTIAGQTYFAAQLTVPIDVEPNEGD